MLNDVQEDDSPAFDVGDSDMQLLSGATPPPNGNSLRKVAVVATLLAGIAIFATIAFQQAGDSHVHGAIDQLATATPKKALVLDAMQINDPSTVDSTWKQIQTNVFQRWCNEKLLPTGIQIYSFDTDFSDGLKLIALLSQLSSKKINRYNKKPTFRPQKLENINIALKFIEEQNIKLVNIDASDILKGNRKLILGLVWTLILKYSVSIPDFDDEEDADPTKITPKQALMSWVKSKLPPEVPVANFGKDWNDGIALAALVDAVAPGLCPEWEDFPKEDGAENSRKALKLAQQWLGIPMIITPEEISNPHVDELSVMTYVSYFPYAKPRPGAPLKPKMNATSKASAKGAGGAPNRN